MNSNLCRPTLIIISLLFALIAFGSSETAGLKVAAVAASETRCGWFSNPTPANASLYDRDAEWIVGVQGGHQADGDWPDFGPGQWVETNGHHGYGCACMRVQTNSKTHEVSRIESARARALSTCRNDAALKRWGFK